MAGGGVGGSTHVLHLVPPAAALRKNFDGDKYHYHAKV